MADLTRLAWPSPVLNENARRKAAWVDHLFAQALADVQAEIAAGEYHPDPEREAAFLAGLRAIGPTMRGEWPGSRRNRSTRKAA